MQQAAVEQLWDSLFLKKEFPTRKAILAANWQCSFASSLISRS